jgi:hypothetical protein
MRGARSDVTWGLWKYLGAGQDLSVPRLGVDCLGSRWISEAHVAFVVKLPEGKPKYEVSPSLRWNSPGHLLGQHWVLLQDVSDLLSEFDARLHLRQLLIQHQEQALRFSKGLDLCLIPESFPPLGEVCRVVRHVKREGTPVLLEDFHKRLHLVPDAKDLILERRMQGDPDIEDVDGLRIGVEETVEESEHHAPHDVFGINQIYRLERAFTDVNEYIREVVKLKIANLVHRILAQRLFAG